MTQWTYQVLEIVPRMIGPAVSERLQEELNRLGEEARDLGQSPIGTQHVLLALLADPQSSTARVLQDNGVDAGHVRAEVIRLVGRGPVAQVMNLSWHFAHRSAGVRHDLPNLTREAAASHTAQPV